MNPSVDEARAYGFVIPKRCFPYYALTILQGKNQLSIDDLKMFRILACVYIFRKKYGRDLSQLKKEEQDMFDAFLANPTPYYSCFISYLEKISDLRVFIPHHSSDYIIWGMDIHHYEIHHHTTNIDSMDIINIQKKAMQSALVDNIESIKLSHDMFYINICRTPPDRTIADVF